MQHPFFLALQRGNDPHIDTYGCSAQQLAQHREISTSNLSSAVHLKSVIWRAAASHRFRLLTEKGAWRRPATALLPAATEFGVGQTKSYREQIEKCSASLSDIFYALHLVLIP